MEKSNKNIELKDRDLLLLIGAGCSADANIPVSKKMVDDLEYQLDNDPEWKQYKKLYGFLKNTAQIGININEVEETFHIEKLLIIIKELLKGKNTTIYPFTNGWSMLYNEFITDGMKNLKSFDEKIRKHLPKWVIPSDRYRNAAYYKKFYEFQKQIQPYTLRIFSLNYDICFERCQDEGYTLETGFGQRDDEVWDEKNFTETENGGIHLYKLHGSIDWTKDNQTQKVKKTQREGIDESFLIFGTDEKVQAIDPYLFYLHEFRRWTLQCKMIITIGYSFGDDHINTLLTQSLRESKREGKNRLIFNVSNQEEENQKEYIKQKLNLDNSSQIKCISSKAKDFLENNFNIDFIGKLLPKDDNSNLPF